MNRMGTPRLGRQVQAAGYAQFPTYADTLMAILSTIRKAMKQERFATFYREEVFACTGPV